LLLPDNERLAVYYLLQDRTGCLGVWNWRSGQPLNLLPLPAWSQSLTYPDLCANGAGTRLVALGEQSHVRVFDMTTPPGRVLRTWDGDQGPRWYHLSPDGRWLAGAARAKGLLWNIETGEFRAGPEHKSEILDACFSPDGRFLATASHDRTVRLWDVQAQTPASEPLVHPGAVYSQSSRRTAATC
jgi:WD40 repeat protein